MIHFRIKNEKKIIKEGVREKLIERERERKREREREREIKKI